MEIAWIDDKPMGRITTIAAYREWLSLSIGAHEMTRKPKPTAPLTEPPIASALIGNGNRVAARWSATGAVIEFRTEVPAAGSRAWYRVGDYHYHGYCATEAEALPMCRKIALHEHGMIAERERREAIREGRLPDEDEAFWRRVAIGNEWDGESSGL